MSDHRGFIVIAATFAAWGWLSLSPHDGARMSNSSAASTTALLAAPADDAFARALTPRPFDFPRDHRAHPSFRSEWWYFTGHLRTDGHDDNDTRSEYGFQLTLFRFETDAARKPSASRWRTPRVMLGHFAISDIATGEFRSFERLARAVGTQAGVGDDASTLAWIDDWQIDHDASNDSWLIAATHGTTALELVLTADAAPVLQGDGGLSRKSAAPGNASYYYSLPRMRARGRLRHGDVESDVRGSAWLDREWSTSALDRHQRGWDWFALQLDDGASVMFYRLRRADGSSDPFSAGTLVLPHGEVVALTRDDVELQPLAWWTSPATRIRYPSRWRLSLPARGRDYVLTPRLAAQEWRGRFRYWEGAVEVTPVDSNASAGLGYVEMTGY